jgi:hypothetical protein
MGALKGRFQCLRRLQVKINNHKDHRAALQWITVTIILHNLIIDIKGSEGICTEWEDGNAGGDMQGASGLHNGEDEGEDKNEDDPAVQKRNQLIAELLWAKHGDQPL